MHIKNYFFLFLFFSLGIVPSLPAQDLNNSQKESIAYSFFTKATDEKNPLPNKTCIQLLESADSLFRLTENKDFSIASILILSNLYQIEREYEKLNITSEYAIDIANHHLSENHDYYTAVYNFRGGVILENKRDYINAIPLFKKTIEIEKNKNLPGIEMAPTYFNLGTCYQYIGDYDLAINQFQKALTSHLDSIDFIPFLTPSIYNQLGLCYSNKNQYDLAIETFKKGIKVAQKNQPSKRNVDQIILYLYQNLADLYSKKKQYSLAKKHVLLALDFQKNQAFIKNYYTHILQGEIFLKEEKFNAAVTAFQKSTLSAKIEYKDFERHPEIGLTYLHTGESWLLQNNPDKALEYFQLAMINNSSTFESTDPVMNPSLNKLINPLSAIDLFEAKAKAYLQKYKKQNNLTDLKTAFDNYSFAIEAISKTRQSFNADGSKHSLAEKVIPVFENAIETAFKLFEQTNDEVWLQKGFQFAERNKAAALFDAIQKTEALGNSTIPDSLLNKEYDLKVEIAFYKNLIHEKNQQKNLPGNPKRKTLKSTLFDLEESYQNLIDLFEKNYPDYYTLKFRKEQTNTKTIQKQLNNKALIEFFVGHKHIYVFTLTTQNIRCERVIKNDHFESNIKSLRTIISKAPSSKNIQQSLDDFRNTSEELFQSLINNSLQQTPNSVEHLIIIPDDLLAYLPFSLLLKKEDESSKHRSFKTLPYLFKQYGISYNYSAAFWLKYLNKKPAPTQNDFIGFAPTFSAYNSGKKLSPLSCNTREVDQIAKHFQTKDIHLERDATLEEFKTNATNYRIIHLATHTTLDNQNSAFNRIYFSDHYFSQNDLHQVKLNASLAVLSACNTGSGELKKGEGVMSLSRGFIHAGCPSILMSLWSVDDCTTADIMLNYYKGLKAGKTKEVALLVAKEDYLKNTEDILQAHPYYWAAFVQYGNTEPLAFSTFHGWTYWLIGGFLFFALIAYIYKKFKKT